MFSPPPWAHYSHLLKEKILSPRFAGILNEEDLSGEEMSLVIGMSERNFEKVKLYFIIDRSDGVVAEVKFQALGSSPLIGAAECACALALRKTWRQVSRITGDLIDRKARDFPTIPSFPNDALWAINLVLEAVDHTIFQCNQIEFSRDPSLLPPPTPIDEKQDGQKVAWEILSHREKRELIDQVIQREIQPYIALDAGGIEVIDLRNDQEVIIGYQGACQSCPSSTGSTLQAIEHILQAQISSHLIVKPDLSFLTYVDAPEIS